MNSTHTAGMYLGRNSMNHKPASGDTSAPRVRMREDFRKVCVAE